jgi:hypothetical protein
VKIIQTSVLAATLVWSAACGHAPPPVSSAPATTHQHRAPHGGVLVELGGEAAHVELVLDPDAGSLTAYILDGEAEESVRLKQSSVTIAIDTSGSSAAQVLELPARANILTGETVGDSSEFSATSPSLLGMKSIRGRIVDIVVKGQDFRDVRF